MGPYRPRSLSDEGGDGGDVDLLRACTSRTPLTLFATSSASSMAAVPSSVTTPGLGLDRDAVLARLRIRGERDLHLRRERAIGDDLGGRGRRLAARAGATTSAIRSTPAAARSFSVLITRS